MKNNQDIAYEVNDAKEEYENAVQELEDFVEQCENGEEDKEDSWTAFSYSSFASLTSYAMSRLFFMVNESIGSGGSFNKGFIELLLQ